MQDDTNSKPFNRLVGTWITEATHPLMPGVVVHGTAVIEWLEGGHFLINRAHTDHPDFPDAISISGNTNHDRVDGETGKISESAELQSMQMRMHYYDDRGVFRDGETTLDDLVWRITIIAKGFSQRFEGTLTENDTVIDGLWQLREDDVHWKDDLKITYRLRLPA
ncbi:MAG: hypothetical protein ABI120_19620 [Gemmatimonadaceae bacterium]